MPDPLFNSVALTTEAAKEVYGSPRARAFVENMPDIDGAFVQPHGRGGRQILVSGVYKSAAKATAALAVADLKSSFRTIQQMICDGAYTYTGEDSSSFTGCMLLAYSPGRIFVGPGSGGTFVARARVTAIVLDPNP